MTRRSISVLLGLLAVVAIGVVWVVGGFGGSTKGTEEPAARVREASGAPSSPSPELAALPGEAELRAIAVESEPSVPQRTGAAAPESDRELASGIWIDGRVIIPRGTPPDEQVVIVAEGMPFESREFHRVSPGPDGTFRIAFARDTRLGVLRLEGRYLYLRNYVTINLPAKSAEIVLRPVLGGCIQGRVLLPLSASASPETILRTKVSVLTRQPQDVHLSGKSEVLTTTGLDEELRFELRGVRGPENCSLVLGSSDAWHAEPVDVTVSQGRISTADLLVEATARFSGVVLDPDGQPVSDAHVRVRRTDRPTDPSGLDRQAARIRSDHEGRYESPGLAAGAYQVWAEANDAVNSVPTDLALLPGQELSDLVLRLSRGGRIVGEVIDPDGTPSQAIAVHASSSGGPGGAITIHSSSAGGTEGIERFLGSVMTTTDSQGRFEFGKLVPGRYELTAGRRTTRSIVVQVEDGQTAQVVIGGRSEESITVYGTVRSGGRPAAGWHVRPLSFGGIDFGLHSTTCDKNGAYRITLDHPGWFTFEVGPPDRGASHFEPVELPHAKTFERDFDFAGKGRITGRVVDAKGAAAPGVMVTAAPDAGTGRPSDRAYVGHGSTDALGAFAFEGVPAGTYRLEARDGLDPESGTPSDRASPASVHLDEGESIDGVVLTVQETCSLVVSVRRADGKTVPYASVEAVGQGVVETSGSYSSSAPGLSRHELKGLRPGEVTVTASTDDPPLAGSSTVVLAPGEKGRVEIVLQPATVLLVRFEAPGRDPRDVLVKVRDPSGASVGYVVDIPRTGQDRENASERRFGPVASGRYTVVAEHPDGSRARSEIEITGEAQHVVLLNLQP